MMKLEMKKDALFNVFNVFNVLKRINSTRTLLWSTLLIIGSTVITTAAHSAKETAIHNKYLQTMQQCERKLAPAQCQRTATLIYETEQHTLKQQKIIQMQAIRTLKIQQKTIYPRLSQQQKLPKTLNKRPLLQGNLPRSNVISLKNSPLITAKKHEHTSANSLLVKPRLITAKKYKYTVANSVLIKPIKVKLVDFKKRQADSNQKILRRLANNNKRREQGFIVDSVIMP